MYENNQARTASAILDEALRVEGVTYKTGYANMDVRMYCIVFM